MASLNPNPKRIPILDSFPNAPVRHRRERGGRLRSLGSVRGGASGSVMPSSSSGTISRGSISKKSSSKGKELPEPLQEPLVEEIVTNDLSFENDRKSLRFAIRGMTTERTQARLSKRKVVEEDSEDDEDENTSLIARPRARRHIVSENEVEVTPVCASLTEPVHIPSEDETTPRDTNESIHRLFVGGFESGELGPSIHEAEEIARGAQLEAANWKEQFENAQGTIEELLESRNLLEQQKRGLTSELAVAKASSSQFEKDKERLECSFSEQLSNCSEEIRELKVLLAKKEEYAGELVQSLTQAQADLKISSDKASQENFDLNSELAKVLETIERTQQPLDFPSPSIEAPVAEEPLNEEAVAMAVEVENVAIPASEGETSMTQSVEVEASVTLASLVDPNISSSAETVPVAASSE
uniref:Myosin-6-like n=1 Tax=Nicotiana sylvestris TaxID=4096 RepID=A0A1U7Y7R1_NICSY